MTGQTKELTEEQLSEIKNYAKRSATLDFNYSIAHGKAAISDGSDAVHELIIPSSL